MNTFLKIIVASNVLFILSMLVLGLHNDAAIIALAVIVAGVSALFEAGWLQGLLIFLLLFVIYMGAVWLHVAP